MTCGKHIGPFPCCSVINADNRELLENSVELPDDCVIITDPPYGIAHPCDFKKRRRNNLAKCTDYADVAGDYAPFDPRSILALNVPTVLWGANHYSDKVPGTSGWLVWDKNRPDNLDQATCELAWTNFVKGVRRKKITWHGMMRCEHGGSGVALAKSVLIHPTQKPVSLTEWILSLPRWTPPGMVIDLFSGSGSALVAAKRANRHYLGFELSKEYCVQSERWLLDPFAAGFEPESEDDTTLKDIESDDEKVARLKEEAEKYAIKLKERAALLASPEYAAARIAAAERAKLERRVEKERMRIAKEEEESVFKFS